MRAVVPDAGDLGRGGVTPPVRVRIAPSPTGYFHVGSARTALYNWCVARRAGGTFILRIEDTDRERHQESQYEGIIEALRWLEIDWDEGPYRQSERTALYADAIDRLWDAGYLYACDCTRQEVLERTKKNAIPGYDGYCRHRGLERGPGRALRFAMPDGGVTVVRDVIRGDVEFANHTIEDFVVARSNGDALFVLAVVVDDRDMAISHVIRAEEHLPTTPKAVLLWEALNRSPARGESGGGGADSRELPVFAHLPLLVNEKRQKISKRRDRVAIEDYRAQGFLPEAIGNYLALLGWSFHPRPLDGGIHPPLPRLGDGGIHPPLPRFCEGGGVRSGGAARGRSLRHAGVGDPRTARARARSRPVRGAVLRHVSLRGQPHRR